MQIISQSAIVTTHQPHVYHSIRPLPLKHEPLMCIWAWTGSSIQQATVWSWCVFWTLHLRWHSRSPPGTGCILHRPSTRLAAGSTTGFFWFVFFFHFFSCTYELRQRLDWGRRPGVRDTIAHTDDFRMIRERLEQKDLYDRYHDQLQGQVPYSRVWYDMIRYRTTDVWYDIIRYLP